MIPAQIMQDTIGIRRLTGNGAYGPIFNVQENVKCYFETGSKKIFNTNGEEIVVSGMAIVTPSVSVGIGDFVSHNSQNYLVIDVQILKVLGKVNHQELLLQSVSS